jgi:hypothetical protein
LTLLLRRHAAGYPGSRSGFSQTRLLPNPVGLALLVSAARRS